MTELKKKGRPKGSKNKKKVPTLAQRRSAVLEPIGKKFKFTSDLCPCVYYSEIMGAAMFCIHRNPLMARET